MFFSVRAPLSGLSVYAVHLSGEVLNNLSLDARNPTHWVASGTPNVEEAAVA